MNPLPAVAALGTLALAACEPAAPARPPICNPDDYQQLVGQNIGAVTLPSGIPQRVLTPGDVMTQELMPARVNIYVDDKGWISRITCG